MKGLISRSSYMVQDKTVIEFNYFQDFKIETPRSSWTNYTGKIQIRMLSKKESKMMNNSRWDLD